MVWKRWLVGTAAAGALLGGCNDPCSMSSDPCCSAPTTGNCMQQQACTDAPTPECCAAYVPNGGFAIYEACLAISDGGVPDGGDGG